MGFRFRIVAFLLIGSSLWSDVNAQTRSNTLTQQLREESPDQLVVQARESGNIVRGAILFHQGNINCAKCHQPANGTDRLAPLLSYLGNDATDASLVESILDPSKKISKGYETLNVVTIDGVVISGLVVSQDERFVVLRSSQDIDKVHKIPMGDIEESSPGTVSIMPAGLVDELTGRQQFLDLLRYVIDLKERGPTDTMPSGESTPPRELTPELKGLVLIRKHNCVACHESSLVDSIPGAYDAPNLRWSALNLDPQYLAQFIAAPHQTKPGTSMPDVLGNLEEPARKSAAESIAHFLVSIGGNEFQMASGGPEGAPDVDCIERGHDLFHSVGCVVCHAPRDKEAVEEASRDSVAMGSLAPKYDSDGLVAFLKDPHIARPGGRMPNMQLTHREAQDLADYLLQANYRSAPESDSPASQSKPWQLDTNLAAQGKRWFEQLNCNACHDGVIENPSASKSLVDLATANTTRGCLSGREGAWPRFALSDSEIADIKATLDDGLQSMDRQQTIDFTLASYRCTACHSRDGLGGVSEQRRKYFQTTDLNLGEQGRIPPTLTGVGAKLNPKWMRDVLVNGRSIRPYMKTRMPKYDEHHVGHLVDLFPTTDKLADTRFAKTGDSSEARKEGLKLVGNQGLNCAACHTYQYKLSDTMPAVDLTEMAQRLKKDWFYQYMMAPQKFSPNTVMPSYWPGGVALRSDIAGTPEDQIETIWQYLLEGRQARAPAGVIKKPLEIVVTNEARILRRQYPEIGKRGIGVGYPGGVNLAYDAQQMRLATIWKGKFADPAAAWYGQGSGNVRAMGPTLPLPKGPELFDPTEPQITDDSRPSNYQFKGYSLDNERRPTLRYEIGSIAVEDYFSEFKDDTTNQVQLRRRVTINSSDEREEFWFRLANSETIERDTNGSYRIGGQVVIKVVSDQTPKIGDKGLLYLPLKLAPRQPQELVIEYRW